MRILHVNKYHYRRGGAEAYMIDLAALQAGAGHEVEFYGMAHPDNEPRTYASDFAPHIELEPHPAGVAAKVGAAARVIWSPSARRGMARVVERFRPDIVHLHNIYHQLSPSILRPPAERGIPTVMTLHDYKMACPTYQFLDHGKVCEACLGGRFHHAALRRCKDDSFAASALASVEMTLHSRGHAYSPVQAFICPSHFAEAKMREAGVFPDRLHWLRHFIDTSEIAAKCEPGGPVVYAGRLAPEKAVDVLIDAVALAGRDVQLHVAGDGPLRAALEAQATRVAPGQVTFRGRLDKDDLHHLLRSASALAMPSRWYEDAPMIVLEAYACGIPVIGTTLGGVPELIRPGEDGDLVPPEDAKALAASVRGVLENPVWALQMGLTGRRKVERDWSPDAHLAGLDRVYGAAALSVSR